MADWANLPRELLQLIARRLALDDYMNFAAVCTSWRCEATKENYNPKTRLPWSMVILNKSTRFFPFSRPERKLPKAQAFCKGRAPYLSQGWLLKGESYISRTWIFNREINEKLTLFNPFSRASVVLPALEIVLEYLRKDNYVQVTHFAISASPSLSANYIVMICLLEGHMWAWRSKQGTWMRVGIPPSFRLFQLIHYKGQFVALDHHRQILTLGDDDVANDDVAKAIFTVRMQIDKEVFHQSSLPYLVECSGSLLLVGYIDGKLPGAMRVIEADLDARNWTEVKSLGNASIFLNHIFLECFSVELDGANESISNQLLEMVKPNCIYFVNLKRANGLTYKPSNMWRRIYHLDDGHVEEKLLGTGNFERPAWIQPSF